VAVAEVSALDTVRQARAQYERDVKRERRHETAAQRF
jgi:TPP-dependent trihydroxycyclohexane-1,2-dione (THcHDO) dehydratase